MDSREERVERVARKLAARKMGLQKDPNGERLPDELWSQCIFDAEAAIAALSPDERLIEALTEAEALLRPWRSVEYQRCADRITELLSRQTNDR